MRIDRGLDPPWSGNPGRGRPRAGVEMQAGRGLGAAGLTVASLRRERILAEDAIEKTEALTDDLGPAAVQQFLDSPLLPRQLAGGQRRGDLPAGWIEPEFRDALGTRARVARLTPGTGTKQADVHSNISVEEYRRVLAALFQDADLAVVTPPHRDDKSGALADLVLVRQFDDGRIWRLSTRAHDERHARITTVHRIKPRDARSTAHR